MAQRHIGTDKALPLPLTVVFRITKQREQDFVCQRYYQLAVGTAFGSPVFGRVQMFGQGGVLAVLVAPVRAFQLVEIAGYAALLVGERIGCDAVFLESVSKKVSAYCVIRSRAFFFIFWMALV